METTAESRNELEYEVVREVFRDTHLNKLVWEVEDEDTLVTSYDTPGAISFKLSREDINRGTEHEGKNPPRHLLSHGDKTRNSYHCLTLRKFAEYMFEYMWD